MYPIIAMIGYLILNLKRGEILIHLEKGQLVVSVERNMWVNALLGLIVAMVVVKDCPNVRSHVKGNIQAQSSGPNSEFPKRNSFYALKTRGEQESSLDVVTYML